MDPSQVRRKILDEHEQLRRRLDVLETRAQGLAGGDSTRVAPTLDALSTMRQVFADHLALEEAILVPALRDTDSFGPERARQVLAEHREQRVEMAELARELAHPGVSPSVVGQRVLDWVEALRVDMAHEERAILSPDLLRDDVVAIGLEAG